ncbi:hypothetical protein J3458_021916 [Metarhizium acridum]|uniref:uncharacterized protein n=1 Tax=Metarhizium acridum TaxID=92637 RepID=UPI001C6CAA08|nr:hypothetical protein J3458_021916 [Metarhizium acridum]
MFHVVFQTMPGNALLLMRPRSNTIAITPYHNIIEDAQPGVIGVWPILLQNCLFSALSITALQQYIPDTSASTPNRILHGHVEIKKHSDSVPEVFPLKSTIHCHGLCVFGCMSY